MGIRKFKRQIKVDAELRGKIKIVPLDHQRKLFQVDDSK